MPDSLSKIGCTHLRYHRWAFERYFDVVEQLPEEKLLADHGTSFGSIYRTLLHVCQADSNWWARLSSTPVKQVESNIAPGIAPLKEHWFRLLDGLNIWAGGLSEDDWLTPVEYSNSKGVQFRTPVWQVVFHLVNHGTAHRGQVGAILRQIGVTPPNSDLINLYRLEAAEPVATGSVPETPRPA
jgi:uncharacterized damage-inducible protein DinB